MATALLVLSLFNVAFETGGNIHTVVKSVKAVHHHVLRPAYRHTVKPVVHHLEGKK